MSFARFFTSKGTGCPVPSGGGTKARRGHSGLTVSTPLIVRNAGVSPTHKPVVGSSKYRPPFTRFFTNQIAWPVLLLVMLGAARARPKTVGELVIIANSTVRAEEISAADLRSVYLGTKTSLEDGTHLKPVLEKPGPAHSVFLKEYMGKSDIALQTYYRSLLFSGKWSIPVTLRSDSEMVAYVAKTPDAIGYAQSNAVIQGVKILHIK